MFCKKSRFPTSGVATTLSPRPPAPPRPGWMCAPPQRYDCYISPLALLRSLRLCARGSALGACRQREPRPLGGRDRATRGSRSWRRRGSTLEPHAALAAPRHAPGSQPATACARARTPKQMAPRPRPPALAPPRFRLPGTVGPRSASGSLRPSMPNLSERPPTHGGAPSAKPATHISERTGTIRANTTFQSSVTMRGK